MKDSIYIVINRNGIRDTRKNKPNLNGGEVAVRVEISVPDTYFHRSILTATITLPEPVQLTEDDITVGFDPEIVKADPLDRLFEEEKNNNATEQRNNQDGDRGIASSDAVGRNSLRLEFG